MQKNKFKFFLGPIWIFCYVYAEAVFGISYRLPETYVVVSPNTEYLARIVPAEEFENGDVFPAKAEIYRFNEKKREFAHENTYALLNETAPSNAYIADNGILVTYSDWGPFHDVSHDLVIYSLAGEVIREYSESDFFTSSEAEQYLSIEIDPDLSLLEAASFAHSTKRFWMCGEPFFYRGHYGDTVFELGFYDAIGRRVRIDVRSGEFTVEVPQPHHITPCSERAKQ